MSTPPLAYTKMPVPTVPRMPGTFVTNTTIDPFQQRYYSGLDVGIYCDSIYLDEVVSLQFQITENKAPYYGYGSYTPKRFAPGTRFVQGSFAINFTETFYLYKLLKMLKDREAKTAAGEIPNTKSYRTIQQALTGSMTLTDLMALSNGAQTAEARLRVFNQVADGMDAALWGSATQTSKLPVRANKPLFDAGPNGFSIYIRYGEPLQPARQTIFDPATPSTWPNPNLDLPEVSSSYSPGKEAVGTVHRIVGVEILGCGQQVDTSGQPLMEVYQFAARDIDEATDPNT